MSDFDTVLGAHAELLTTLAGPLLESSVDEVENGDVNYEKFFDGVEVLGDRQSPELHVWQNDKLGMRLRDQGKNIWNPPGCGWLFASSKAEDGNWLVRLQSIFLPVSSVLTQGEVYTTASWHPTAFGTSRVYSTHQDEPGVRRDFASLAGFLSWRIAKDESLEVDDATRASLSAAVLAQNEADTEVFPDHLDPEKLQVRTRWIGELLIGQHVTLFDTSKGLYYDRLEGIPSFETYAAERHLIAEWPHLAAYWMVHHAFLGNEEALADVLTLADDRYPPIGELRHIAAAFTQNGACPQLVGNGPHQALIRDVVRHDKGGMCADAIAKVRAEIDADEALLAVGEATLQALRGRTDETTVLGLKVWDLLQDCAGDLKPAERQLMEQMVPDEVARDRYRTRVTAGETTPFVGMYRNLMNSVDTSWAPVFEANFTAGASVSEDHASAAPGALVGWGKALGSFEALEDQFNTLCKSAGSRRFMELAMVADAFPDEPRSLPFLVKEMNDFLGDLGDWERNTMSFAFFALLDRKHPEALEAARNVLEKGPMNGASWQTLLALVAKVEELELTELAPSVKALVERGYGRDDDGTRGAAMRAWAGLAGGAAVPELESMLETLSDGTKRSEEAQVLAGLLTADPSHVDGRARAGALARTLLETGDSMNVGAASVLIGAMEDAGLEEALVLRASSP